MEDQVNRSVKVLAQIYKSYLVNTRLLDRYIFVSISNFSSDAASEENSNELKECEADNDASDDANVGEELVLKQIEAA